jgi:hypothetical protein
MCQTGSPSGARLTPLPTQKLIQHSVCILPQCGASGGEDIYLLNQKSKTLQNSANKKEYIRKSKVSQTGEPGSHSLPQKACSSTPGSPGGLCPLTMWGFCGQGHSPMPIKQNSATKDKGPRIYRLSSRTKIKNEETVMRSQGSMGKWVFI